MHSCNRHRRPFKGGLTLLFALAAANASLAQVPAEGPYAGIGGAVGFEDFDDLPAGADPDPAGGLDVWGGYRANQWFAGEAQVEYLNGFDFDGFESQLVNFHVNAKVFPLAEVCPIGSSPS